MMCQCCHFLLEGSAACCHKCPRFPEHRLSCLFSSTYTSLVGPDLSLPLLCSMRHVPLFGNFELQHPNQADLGHSRLDVYNDAITYYNFSLYPSLHPQGAALKFDAVDLEEAVLTRTYNMCNVA